MRQSKNLWLRLQDSPRIFYSGVCFGYLCLFDWTSGGFISNRVALWKAGQQLPRNVESMSDIETQIRSTLSKEDELKQIRRQLDDKLRCVTHSAERGDTSTLEYCLKEAKIYASATGEMHRVRATVNAARRSLLQKAQFHANKGEREEMERNLKKAKEWFDV